MRTQRAPWKGQLHGNVRVDWGHPLSPRNGFVITQIEAATLLHTPDGHVRPLNAGVVTRRNAAGEGYGVTVANANVTTFSWPINDAVGSDGHTFVAVAALDAAETVAHRVIDCQIDAGRFLSLLRTGSGGWQLTSPRLTTPSTFTAPDGNGTAGTPVGWVYDGAGTTTSGRCWVGGEEKAATLGQVGTGAVSTVNGGTSARLAQSSGINRGWIGAIPFLYFDAYAREAVEMVALTEDPSVIFARRIWEPVSVGAGGGGSTHDLAGSNSTQANTSSSGAVTQTHALAGANSVQAAASTTGAVSQVHQLSAANSTQGAASSSEALTADITLAGSTSAQPNTSTGGAVTQVQQLAASNASQAATSTSGAATQVHVLVAANCTQAATSTTGSLIDPSQLEVLMTILASLGLLPASVAPAGAIVGTTDAQTLTNKTLTAPRIAQILDAGGTIRIALDETGAILISGSAGAAGQVLTSAGPAAPPTWQTPTTYQLDADLAAIAALAGNSGFLKKTAADTWALDTSTFLTANQAITLSGDATGSGSTAIAVTLNTVAATKGGTGQTVYAVGDLLYASTTTALSKLAGVATGNVLISGGVGTAPSWGKVGLTTHVSGTLPVANGGTGATTLTGILKGNGTAAFTAVAAPVGALVGDTDTQTLTNKTVTGLKETRVAMGANDVNLASGNYFTKTITGATTFTVSNVPAAGSAGSFILDLTNGGSQTITWWAGVKWAGGTAPVLTAAGRDVLGFFTHDGGTTWSGLVLGKDVK